VTTIRPNHLPQTPQRPQSQDTTKLAAQRAFFAALGQAQTTAGAATATVSVSAPAPPAPATRASAGPPDTPQKILRPGSLFDIRV
jgi:hypothetical protein